MSSSAIQRAEWAARDERMRELVQRGTPAGEIAAAIGLCERQVYYHARRLGLGRAWRRRVRAAARNERILSLLRAGYSYSEVVAELGCSLAAVARASGGISHLMAMMHPKRRGDCEGGQRPCPWVSCQYHLYLDVNPDTGTIKLRHPGREVWELEESCALDVADRGGLTLEEVGRLSGLTRERIRQVEAAALAELREEKEIACG